MDQMRLAHLKSGRNDFSGDECDWSMSGILPLGFVHGLDVRCMHIGYLSRS